MGRILLFASVILLPFLSYSQQDTLVLKAEMEPMMTSMDSLLDLWYIKASAIDTNRSNLNKYGYGEDEIPSFSDSVIRQRLSELYSPIPLDYNHRVKAFIDLYANKRRKQVEEMLGLSHYYFPIFEEELDKQGLPLELKYMPVIESALNTGAVSRMGATGLWQFMYSTGKMYGLEITSYLDERRDPYHATRAAVKYLKDMYGVYNDWLLVIAAYNCGPGNVNKAIRRSGYKKDFWDIYPFLPRETRGYVPAFIAANYVMNYHIEHNLYPRSSKLPKHVDTVLINRELHFKALSKVLNVDEKMLHLLNPQYKKNYIPAGKSAYALKLPMKTSLNFCSLEDSIYSCHDSLFNKEEVKETLLASSSDNASSGSYSLLYYTVKPGDNIGYIAEWYNCGASDVRRWNGINGNVIHVGQRLKIYVPKTKVSDYELVNSMSFAEKQKFDRTGSVPSNSTGGKYYTVRSGDTLWSIARKYPGVSANNIMEWNNISNSKSIKPGQKIIIRN